MREGARGRIARRVPGTVPRPRETGLCSNSRYQLGSLILSASLPGLGYFPLVEETGSERMETWPGFRAQKQQSGFKATLLVTGALVRAPALCRARGSFLLGSQCWAQCSQPGRWPRIPGCSGPQVTPRSWLPARSRAFLSFWASVGTKASKLAPCTWCRLCS